MRTVRFYGIALLTVLLSVSFSACSSSSDADGNNGVGSDYKSLIVGKWYNTDSQGYNLYLEFKRDGTFIRTYEARKPSDRDYQLKGQYKIEGDIIYAKFDGENDWSMGKIKLLDSITLIIHELDEYGQEQGKYPDTLKRTN